MQGDSKDIDAKSHHSVNLFERTNPLEPTEEQLKYVPHMVFMNQVDNFNNKVIANLLVNHIFKDYNRMSITDEPEEFDEEGAEEELAEENSTYR